MWFRVILKKSKRHYKCSKFHHYLQCNMTFFLWYYDIYNLWYKFMIFAFLLILIFSIMTLSRIVFRQSASNIVFASNCFCIRSAFQFLFANVKLQNTTNIKLLNYKYKANRYSSLIIIISVITISSIAVKIVIYILSLYSIWRIRKILKFIMNKN